jgi:uncharacterized protein with PIN domain
MSRGIGGENRFIADRMVGTLTRYLRFIGYDVISANSLREGNLREDTLLLEIAERDDRILLTRDRELARRGGTRAVFLDSADVMDQLQQLIRSGMVDPHLELRMHRCSLCNSLLRPATQQEICSTEYAPAQKGGTDFFWCRNCRRLYWMGSHGRNLSDRLEALRRSLH